MMKKGMFWMGSCLIFIYAAMGLTACGEQEAVQEIALVEPLSTSYVTEPASYRNLYNAEVYTSTVLPCIEEYSFENGGEVERFLAFPGESVKSGETLVYYNLEDIDQDITELEERIADMDKAQTKYVTKVEEELAEPRAEAERLEEIVADYEEDVPSQYITDVSGNHAVNGDYTQWEKNYKKFDGEYRNLSHSVALKETALRQKTELYELDRAYHMENLRVLREDREKYLLKSQINGEVVAIGQKQYDILKPKAEQSVVAVGDTSRKLLKSEYVRRTEIKNAAEVYAVIDGERYAVEYQPMETKEYIRLTESGETVYSVFELEQGAPVEIGDYAAVVIVHKKCENVLAVMADAVTREESQQYIYVLENGERVRRNVKTGMTDGVYTEITEGLTQGELVLVPNPLKHGTETVTVERGTTGDVYLESGFLYYPALTDVKNDIEHGTVYYSVHDVLLHQYVKKGDTIATIYVEVDEVELQRMERELQRMTERLQDVLDKKDPEGNQEIIAQKQEEIELLQQKIAQYKRDGSTTSIVAPTSGIIVKLESFGRDQELKKGTIVAQIADENTCYVSVDNPNEELQYGNEVTITYNIYENKKKVEHRVTGRVANVSAMGVSSDLRNEEAYILVPPEASTNLLLASIGSDKRVGRTLYQVHSEVEKMENVLLVPREAVTQLAGKTYVHEMCEDGIVRPRSFIAGGFDSDNYWVIDGLTEGMKICLE